jgi:pimeloyl-ACP methyl ester carboxylesterase
MPPAATVLTLSGLNFNLTNYMPRQFGGLFARPPYVLRKVSYPASLAADSIARGVAALDAALRETPGPVIVLAHSQGAQVASHWMRAHADDPAAPSGHRLVFLLTGNPLRAEGGYAIGRREVGGTIGQPTPVTSRWRVIDVARRYDGWADWPADTANRRAVEAARAGMMRLHTRYDEVDLSDPTNTVWSRGTTTFVLTRETPPLRTLRASERTVVQAEIERAYRRPPDERGIARP